ncbi:hypothetical protein DCMF_14490 [Candidatus Formimonas warabiya]|uniref:Uncharacterized protein n=1 Tax=Formimonas warabiya TaxID=1761012 RepID=A0A3G1KTI0_FORW1|nr:hypothetical protein DCMF_14490 [Candidatus Formimonas warabiya]
MFSFQEKQKGHAAIKGYQPLQLLPGHKIGKSQIWLPKSRKHSYAARCKIIFYNYKLFLQMQR